MTTNEKLIQMAAGAIDLSPKPEAPPPTGIPLQLMLQFVQLGILSPRQGFYWFFQKVEPIAFDEPSKAKGGRR